MNLPSTGEPFGLPKGTVRDILALVSMGLLVFDFVVDQVLTPELVYVVGPYIAFYFGTRPQEAPGAAPDEPLGEPSIPGDAA